MKGVSKEVWDAAIFIFFPSTYLLVNGLRKIVYFPIWSSFT